MAAALNAVKHLLLVVGLTIRGDDLAKNARVEDIMFPHDNRRRNKPTTEVRWLPEKKTEKERLESRWCSAELIP
jgi:hypothetical protein